MTTTILAATNGAAAFWGTDIGKIVQVILGALAVIILIIAIIRSITHVHQGKHSQAVRLILGAVVLAAFCFDTSLITLLISAFTSVVQAVIQSISNLIGGSGANVNTPAGGSGSPSPS